MLKKPDDADGKSWPAIVIGLFVAFGGVLFGYAITVSNDSFLSSLDSDMTRALSQASLPCLTGNGSEYL